MLTVEFSKKFRKDMKHIQNQPELMVATHKVIESIRHRKKLPARHKDHKLRGNYQGFRECHIKPDLLLIYSIDENTLKLARIGSHSELLGL